MVFVSAPISTHLKVKETIDKSAAELSANKVNNPFFYTNNKHLKNQDKAAYYKFRRLSRPTSPSQDTLDGVVRPNHIIDKPLVTQ